MGIEEWDFAQEFSRAVKWESRNGILSILTEGITPHSRKSNLRLAAAFQLSYYYYYFFLKSGDLRLLKGSFSEQRDTAF